MAEEQATPSLRDSINDAIAEVDAPEVVTSAPETSTVTETPNEPTTTETAKPEAAPVAESVEAKPEVVDEVPVLGEKPADKPPASWKGDAKKVWGELPEAARNEVVRRERQVDQVLKESADARQNVEAINNVVSKHADRIREWNAPIPVVFENLLNADRILSTAPVADRAQFMAQLIKDYNIDISALDAALSGQATSTQGQQPDVSAQVKQLLAQELAPFKERIAAEERMHQEQVSHTIETMSADHVNFPYFQDVREDMADLIEIKAARGVYLSLEQAYSIATGGNPTVNAANQALRERTAALEADATARKARNAAASIGGSPASLAGGADPNDLRGTIAAAMEGGRV
jgi:hypothetical protein